MSRLGVGCTVLFVVSSAFPLIASVIAPGAVPRWLGVADVAVAGLLVAAVAVLAARCGPHVTDRDRLDAFAAARRIGMIVPGLLATFLLAGDRVNWTVLVVGLAWRGWLLLEALPYLSAARR